MLHLLDGNPFSLSLGISYNGEFSKLMDSYCGSFITK